MSNHDKGTGRPVDAGGRAGRPASEGVEHLQRAAREMIAAARSFLDAAEQVVDDRRAVEEISSTVSGIVAGLGESLGRRDAPWAAAAWEREASAGETDTDAVLDDDAGPVVDLTDRVARRKPGTTPPHSAGSTTFEDDTEDWARPLVDPVAPRRPSRVRRISVE